MASIVLVTYSLDQGGTDRVAYQLASGMGQAGMTVTLLCCTSAGKLNDDFRRGLPASVRFVALSARPSRSRLRGQIRNFLAWRRWLRAERPDIILATGNNISWFSGFGTIGLGDKAPRLFIKTTNPIIRSWDPAIIASIRRRIYTWLFNRAEKILTLSQAESRLLQTQFPSAGPKFQAVYNSYITDAFTKFAPARSARADAMPLRLLAAGRLAGQKRFDRLLRAFACASAAKPDTAMTLSIAGDGKDRDALVALARDLQIDGAVEFLGHVDNLAERLTNADLFILSSDYEGLPAVVVEALACDCPVISTDCFPNAGELLSGLPGCYVTERSVEALGAAMTDAIADLSRPGHVRPSLRADALLYTTASSVDSHCRAMGLMQENPVSHAR